MKILLSLAVGLACAGAGVAAGVGIAFCLLRDEDGGPGAFVAVFLCALLGLVIGLVVGLVVGVTGAVMLWRRVWVPVAPLPPAQGDMASGVWPSPPRR